MLQPSTSEVSGLGRMNVKFFHTKIDVGRIPHPHVPGPHGLFPKVLDQYIHSRWGHCLFQCGLATLSLLGILFVQNAIFRAAIVVGIASSAFTVFLVPDSVAATPRKVIGGHLVAAITGTVFAYLLFIPALASTAQDSSYLLNIFAALSVGFAALGMVGTNTEHPPAAGTAIGLVIHSFEWSTILFILISATILSATRIILRPKLVNLL